ncbi:ImuA family protein [Novosphingobium sp. JCM 18896]|uniref:ImuA family protein n=1 Tax=Novosphingobium sp. JCM 18896 TaxID=2989731 RepID=UPI0022237F9D|nr:protein ImuA [Novosphingobium sp. JCM 18896]MCW1430222.1 protein ImuA [Novosphingobium sp. JCM 18896]
MTISLPHRPSAVDLAALRQQIAQVATAPSAVLPFDLAAMDERLAAGGIDRRGLHEIAAASAALSDDAAATLFAAGIAARLAALATGPHARSRSATVLWALTQFDLYAPGLEQAGLAPDLILYAQGAKDSDVLAMAEDGLRDGSLACVIAEVKSADRTATRRLQLAAQDSAAPVLLYRRHRAGGRCPLDAPSSAMTRWRIGTRPSARLTTAGIGRGRWLVELVRQRNGNPFSLELEACDDTGRLALPAAARDRAAARVGATSRAA